MSSFVRAILASFLIFTMCVLTFADTVRLKDGSIIKGKVVSFSGGKFVVAMGQGTRRKELTFMASEVESVTFDDTSTATQPNRNASYEKPDDILPNPPSKTVDPPPTTSQPKSANVDNKMKPVAWTVKVLGDSTANGWTNTGWVVKKGQRIHISGDGTVSLGSGKSTSPSGSATLEDTQKLLKNVPTGALIAVIGDDNNDFIYIGADREITATRDGALFLGINEGNLNDNSGFFNVKIEVFPDGI